MRTPDEFMETRLFRGVSTTQMAKIMLSAREVSFPGGARIFTEGEEADLLHVLLKGVVDLTFLLRIGGVETEVTIDTKQKGDSLGWSSIIPPHIYTLSGNCRTEVSALVVEGRSLLSACEEDPDFGFVFMKNISEVIGTRLRKIQAMFIHEVQRGISMP